MAKIQKIEDHARVIQNDNRNSWSKKDWQCKHCNTRFAVWHSDFKNVRAHMRRKHPMEYRPYTIDEEPENEDRLSLLLT